MTNKETAETRAQDKPPPPGHGAAGTNAGPESDAHDPDGQGELALLLKRAEQGDRSVLPELRKALDATPEIWKKYGDLALQAEGSFIELIAGNNVLMAESLLHKLAEMKGELGGPKPSPLERLLVERVTATWLQVNYADALFAQVGGQQTSPALLRERSQFQQAAERRHLTAIKTLAVVRKLLKPTPSPLDLLQKPVAETSPVARRGGLRLHEAGLSN
jgi:hypothetical protein